MRRKRIDELRESGPVLEQRRDVVKQNPLAGENRERYAPAF